MIDIMTVRKMASLARLELSDERAERMQRELSAILTHVDSIRSAPVDSLTETATAEAQAYDSMREDVAVQSLAIDTVLQTAPDHAGRLFRVARVLGEE